MATKQRNFFTHVGASDLARTIERFWAEKGKFVTCRVEPIPGAAEGVWQVRSDIPPLEIPSFAPECK